MNSKIIFTICAKNYLALAKTLMNSIIEHGNLNSAKLFVFVADELKNDEKFIIDNCTITGVKELNLIPDYHSFTYKYNVTEWCTALKPFCIDYLTKKESAETILYFDPDICVFSDIDVIYRQLNNKLCVLTPHYLTPQINYTGIIPEGMILWGGIFNLGFILLNTLNKNYTIFIDWWKNRLIDQCYADKQDGLHTDQKWIDYLPSFFPDDICISHHLGMNVSIWNLHERMVAKDVSGKYYIKEVLNKEQEFPLVFFHFSGFSLNDKKVIHKHYPTLTTNERPEMSDLLSRYRELLYINGIETTIKWKYTYDFYDNGYPVFSFQRRLYRRLLHLGYDFDNPFETTNKYYSILKRNNLIGTENKIDKLNSENIKDFNFKIKVILCTMRIVQRFLGVAKYSILLKFLHKYVRPENQIFLIKEFKDNFVFYNENKK